MRAEERSESPESDSNGGDGPGGRGSDQAPARKRQRVRLSCLECRRRKLSYESRNGEVLEGRRFGLGLGLAASDVLSTQRQDHDRIRRLELEISQLKGQLVSRGSTHSTANGTDETVGGAEKGELRFFRGKGFRTRYFGPHNASMAFVELTGLCPFMRETADEWLRPSLSEQADAELEALLPTREETDALVAVYLDQFEQIHRIVHIPTFGRDYAAFWKPDGRQRYAAFTALSLKFIGMTSNARHWAQRCIAACDAWLARQSQKHRKLVHFQIACLLYLGKRVNTIKKKRFWTGAGALIQDGIALGLHREPSHMAGNISVYTQEMRRRIWATVQEFDMQASFDHGLPTLLSQLHYDTNPPRNLDDDAFDEDTAHLPPSKPPRQYTFCSFQNLSRQSLQLRLELSRLLTGPLSEIDYDHVIRYTNDLTQEIDALPSWDAVTNKSSLDNKNPLIAYTLLHVQLRQYIIPLHQPYLKLRKQNSKYQYSEIIYYNAARDIVLLHDKLHEQGVRALSFLREDALTTAINLCSVTLLQPRGSTNMIMINSPHTLKLIEKCICIKEDRLLRCGNYEPWGYSIMCSALGLLEAHLGTKTPEAAKSTSAERFINLHYRLLANQQLPQLPATPLSSNAAPALSAPSIGPSPGLEVPDRAKSMTPFSFNPTLSTVPADAATAPWIMGDQPQPFNLDPSLELLGLNLNELWGESWELG
ncbi:hypothetical protein CDD81_7475 [Ophiocordyceps australis]|uniref:Xylanolytic transcriptional activator regulatory domain-containing protein n=1 Tax=Ophiocordyceps australis TaxID=1399860 RepID=A0A2C5YG04_9HYPO|nr:hypothetical protein CDD81_7475 [Ophiocordyceps australis]